MSEFSMGGVSTTNNLQLSRMQKVQRKYYACRPFCGIILFLTSENDG